MLITKLALNNQGRLILKENGKLVIPHEQFANAIMMKHRDGPHGTHLNLESTVKSVMECFAVGKESFGMEQEFITELVQNCPNPACRYYKTAVEVSHNVSNIGLIYTQDPDVAPSQLLRTNFCHNSEYKTVSIIQRPQ